MKYQKHNLILKEAIKKPETLKRGDTIAIKLENGNTIKFSVISNADGSIVLSSGKSKYKIPLDALTKDDSKLPFEKIEDGNKTNGSVNTINISQMGKAPDSDNSINLDNISFGDTIRINTKEKGTLTYNVTSITDDLIELDGDSFDETHYIDVNSNLTKGSEVLVKTPTTSFNITINSIEISERSSIDVDSITDDDILRFITKDGRIFKFTVNDIDDDVIIVESNDTLLFIDKESLRNYTETGYITYRLDDADKVSKLTIKKVDHKPMTKPETIEPDTNLDDGDFDYERIDKINTEFATLNIGDTVILPIVSKGGKLAGTVKFKIMLTVNPTELNVDYVESNGFSSKFETLLDWDDIFIRTSTMSPIEGVLPMDMALVVQRGTEEKSLKLPGVGNITYERTSGKPPKVDGDDGDGLGTDFIEGFYNTLKDMDGDSLLKLNMNDGNRSGVLHLEPKGGHYDGSKVIVQAFDRTGSVRPFYSDLETLADSEGMLLDNNSFVIGNDTEKGELTLVDETGKKLKITHIIDYEIDTSDKDIIQDLGKLSDEEKQKILFNDKTIQDTIIKDRGLFAKLFGTDKLGWISSIERHNKEVYGNKYDNLKKGNSIYFTFIGETNKPYSPKQTLKGKMVEKDEIRIKSIVSNVTYITLIKILSNTDDEDNYDVNVKTSTVSKNNVVNDSETYRSIINIKKYNV